MGDDIVMLGFGFDTSGLQQGAKAFDVLSASAQHYNVVQTQVTFGAEAMAAKAKQTGEALKKQAEGHEKVSESAGKHSAAWQKLSAMFTGFGQNAQQMSNQVQGAASKVEGLAASFGVGAGAGAAGGLTGALNQSGSGVAKFMSHLGPVGAAIGGATIVVGGLAAAWLGVQAGLAAVQDQYISWEGRLKNSLGSSAAAKEAIAQIARASIDAGIALTSSVDAFARLARNKEALRATTDELMRLTETVQKLGIVSGASQGEVASGMLQLSQALASGRLNGDELRSIMENMPALAKAIADGLGVGVGEMRRLGAEGKLTSDQVFKAILSQAGKVKEEFESMPITAGRAFTSMKNQGQEVAKAIAERFKSSEFMKSVYDGIREALKKAEDLIKEDPLEIRLKVAMEANVVPEVAARAKAKPEGERTPEEQRALSSYVYPSRLARMFGAQPPPEISATVERLQKELDAERTRATLEREESERVKRGERVEKGLKLVKEEDDIKKRASTLEEQKKIVEAMIEDLVKFQSLGLGMTTAEWTTRLKDAENVLASINVKLKQNATDFEKMVISNREFLVDLYSTGGGAEFKFMQQARQLAEQATKQGRPAGVGQVFGELVQGAAGRTLLAATEVDAQTEALRRQTAVMGASADVQREMRVEMQALEYRMKTFGDVSTPAVERAMRAYTDALRAMQKAQEDASRAQAAVAMREYLEQTAVTLDNVGKGAYEAARAMAEFQRAQMNMKQPGSGDDFFARWTREQQVAGAQTLENLREQLRVMQEMGKFIGRPGEQFQAVRERDLRESMKKIRPEDRGEFEALQREAWRTSDEQTMRAANANLREQIRILKESESISKANRVEYEVQLAVLAKKRELLAQNVDLTSIEAREALKLTAEIARTTGNIREREEALTRLTDMATQMASSMGSAMEKVIFNGGDADDVLQALERDLIMIIYRTQVLEPMVRNLGAAFREMATSGAGGGGWLGQLIGALIPGFMAPTGGGMSAPDLTPVGSPGFFASPTTAREGGVIGYGGHYDLPVKQYRAGGVAYHRTRAEFAEGATPEAYVPLQDGRSIPVTVRGQTGPTPQVTVNIHNNASNVQVRAERKQTGDDVASIDIIVETVESRMGTRIQDGRGLAPVLETTYGLGRSPNSWAMR